MSPDLRCLFFDIDGTLCNYGVDPREALDDVCGRRGVDASLDPYEYYELYEVVAIELPRASYGEISNEAYRRLLEREGYDDLDLAQQIAEEYRRVRLASVSLYPGTNELLQELSRRFSLGVISNGPSPIQRAKLSKFHLGDYFDAIIISGEAGVQKPERAIFRLALEAIGAEPGESAHVGDSLAYDVVGARGAGLVSFWVNRHVRDFLHSDANVSDVTPDYEVGDLRELPHILDGLSTPR